MIVKAADDRSGDIETLRLLLDHPDASAETRKRIEQEIRFMLSGIKGEQEAAYEIDFHFGSSKNYAVIHDLRLEHAGRVAQIDHILMDRFLNIWVCESKRFSEGIAINEHGECSAFFGGKPHGMPSPFEQNKKHCAVLSSAFADNAIVLPRRLGFSMKTEIRSLVLVSKQARISRPKGGTDQFGDIVKADQFSAFVGEHSDPAIDFKLAARLIGTEGLADFADRIARQHKPISFDWHAKFGLSKDPSPRQADEGKLRSTRTKKPVPDADVPGANAPGTDVPGSAPAAGGPAELSPAPGVSGSKSVCHSCRTSVPYPVVKFCRFNKALFGGQIYCKECQKAHTAAGA